MLLVSWFWSKRVWDIFCCCPGWRWICMLSSDSTVWDIELSMRASLRWKNLFAIEMIQLHGRHLPRFLLSLSRVIWNSMVCIDTYMAGCKKIPLYVIESRTYCPDAKITFHYRKRGVMALKGKTEKGVASTRFILKKKKKKQEHSVPTRHIKKSSWKNILLFFAIFNFRNCTPNLRLTWDVSNIRSTWNWCGEWNKRSFWSSSTKVWGPARECQVSNASSLSNEGSL